MKKTPFRPILAVLSLALIGSMLLVACAGGAAASGSSSSSSNGQTVTIKYWDWWVAQSPTIDKEIKLFEAAHPNIKIQKMTQVVDKYPELLQLAFQSGNAPDVFLVPGMPTHIEQIQQGWLMPVNRWATKDWQAQFPAGSFAEGNNVINGKIYSVPYAGPDAWLQFYINTKLFKDAGLVDSKGNVKVPQTWADVRADAKTITQSSGGKVYGYGFGDKQKTVLPEQLWMAQTSGIPDAGAGFDMRTGKYSWGTNPVYANWIKFFMGMKQDGSIVPNAMSMDDEMARAAFAGGKFAMLIGGVWDQTGWQQTNPDFKDYMAVPMPMESATQKSYFYTSPGGWGWAISSQTKHPQEAWEWFQWLNSKDAAIRWVKDGQGLRIQPEANKPEYAPTPQFAQYMQIAAHDVRTGPSPSTQHPEMAQVKEQQSLPSIQDILEGIYTGQVTDYKEALMDLQTRENAELARAIQDAQSMGVKVDPKWWIVPNWNLTKNYVQP